MYPIQALTGSGEQLINVHLVQVATSGRPARSNTAALGEAGAVGIAFGPPQLLEPPPPGGWPLTLPEGLWPDRRQVDGLSGHQREGRERP